jgi:hypothetical protein
MRFISSACDCDTEKTVKSRKLTCITAMTLLAVLALPGPLAAQHARYKLVGLES